ncbi:MAG: PDZ domain-containing protein [Firmicutes bacterium]|nr:PDZ domain-containing protein [Bacillota bacterium]
MISFILELGKIVLATLIQALPIFWVVVLLVYFQYRRAAGMEKKLFGRIINPVGRQVAVSTGLGVLGGLLASLIMLLLGLSLTQIGLLFIWPVALLLLLIHPRYLCFAYAGGIVALAVLILRFLLLPLFPSLAGYAFVTSMLEIHIPALLALVGLLHLIEVLLIYLGGHRGSSPLYFKRADGDVVGAFSLQRFWPIPLAALVATVVLETEIQGVSMPDWWPLIKPVMELEPGQTLQYLAFPAMAALGFSDLALSSSPREKSVSTARVLCLYSVILIALALASEFYSWVAPAGVLFAPLGHEALIHYGNRLEQSRTACYRSTQEGVLLMAVLPHSAAARAGLLTGDLIRRVNGAQVNSDVEFLVQLEESYFMVLLEGFREGSAISVVLNKRDPEEKNSLDLPFRDRPTVTTEQTPLWHRGAALGLIPAPSRQTPIYAQARPAAASSLLRRLWKRYRNG